MYSSAPNETPAGGNTQRLQELKGFILAVFKKQTAVGRHRVFLKTPDENLACIYMAAGVYFLLVYIRYRFCKTYVCDGLWHVVKEMLGNMMSTSTCIGCKLQHIILTVTNPFEMNDT